METKRVCVIQYLLIDIPIDVKPDSLWITTNSGTVNGITYEQENVSFDLHVCDSLTEGGIETNDLLVEDFVCTICKSPIDGEYYEDTIGNRVHSQCSESNQ